MAVNTKSVVYVALGITGVGLLVYAVTRMARKDFTEKLASVNQSDRQSVDAGNAPSDVQEGARRELFSPSGAQSVRAATELYYRPNTGNRTLENIQEREGVQFG